MTDTCPACGSPNIRREGGCLKCLNCGWSRCNARRVYRDSTHGFGRIAQSALLYSTLLYSSSSVLVDLLESIRSIRKGRWA